MYSYQPNDFKNFAERLAKTDHKEEGSHIIELLTLVYANDLSIDFLKYFDIKNLLEDPTFDVS